MPYEKTKIEPMEGLQDNTGSWRLVEYHYSEGNVSVSELHDQISRQLCIREVKCVLTMCLVAVCQQLVKSVPGG